MQNVYQTKLSLDLGIDENHMVTNLANSLDVAIISTSKALALPSPKHHFLIVEIEEADSF